MLWRKLPGSRSAGRVQSVALRLICEREAEIEAFKPREYWTVEVEFTDRGRATASPRGCPISTARGSTASISTARRRRAPPPTRSSRAARLHGRRRSSAAQVRRNPFPPFTTSTLQQEASRKLGFGASRTMRIAQRLYEGIDLDGETVGLITYMRTDGVAHRRPRRSPRRAS